MSSILRRFSLSIFLFGFFLSITITAKAEELEVTIIPRKEVKEYVTNLFRTDLIRNIAKQKGNIISDLILKIAKNPLFVFIPPENPAARLNFTAYLRLLSLRHTQYENPLFGDLYLLHELHHLGTMPYGFAESFDQWNDKMTLNEKESSLFSEALLHIAFPEIRNAFPIKEIWVDRFIREEVQLKPGISNKDLYKTNPMEYRHLLLQKAIAIGHHTYKELDPIEQRSWAYDRSNEMWSEVYWQYAAEIEAHMKRLYELAEKSPTKAAKEHVRWLKSNSKEALVFDKPALEFYKFYKRIESLQMNPALNDFCENCIEAAKKMDQLVQENKIEMTPYVAPSIDLLKMGVSKIVYSLTFPETKQTTEEMWHSTSFDEMYGEAYTRKQDGEHQAFLDAYKEWATPVVKGLSDFAYAYPTNGSNEAIKDTLSLMKAKSPQATLHVFNGEYEGVLSYAKALDIIIKMHDRSAETLSQLKELTKPGDVFYISQPSSLDGNIWKDYDSFMKHSQEAKLKVLVDLAYVGAVAKKFEVNVSYPHIDSVFFSLSKVFGTYYQRIGGIFTRKENPMLYGNKWFKNILSLRIGTQLLKKYDVYELPRAYLWSQKTAVLELNKKTGYKVKQSDVVLLAHSDSSIGNVPESMKELYRGGTHQGYVRFCLTPAMSILIDGMPERAKTPAQMLIKECQNNLLGLKE